MAAQSINACIGCWNCWAKAPGQCVLKDEIAASYPDYINSAFASVETMEKLVIYNGSPRRSGSISAPILKKAGEALGDNVSTALRSQKTGLALAIVYHKTAKSLKIEEAYV